jgi:predicted ArsR family transcriptional regulator
MNREGQQSDTDGNATAIDRASVLADGVRRRLFEVVSASASPVDRDEAARAAGVSRSLAAFHLDRLARAGLLEVEFRRRGERSGPGAGRPAKFYRRATGTVIDISVPARRYELAGSVLAGALAAQPSERALRDLAAVARERGATLVRDEPPRPTQADSEEDAERARLVAALRRGGFEPQESAGGKVILRNCPFDGLVQGHREVVCSMNLALLEGAAAEARAAGMAARREVQPGYCCVSLAPTD